MPAYKLLYNSDTVLETETGMYIPVGSIQRGDYDAWLALGNLPEAADGPTPEGLAEAARYDEATAFEDLPEWAAYTTTEAVAAIHDAIFAGATLATVQAQIDALPATIAGMKTGLKAVVAEIITERGILEKMAKAIVYLRDRT